MKVVILAGGLGTRISEETDIVPKPMVTIGGKPILWHIMKIYSHYGFNDFIICLGYKGYIIKEYFSHYYLHANDFTVDMHKNRVEVLTAHAEPWKVTLVDTGADTMTGGRLKRIREYIGNETFLMTYGDGVGDVNIKELLEFHRKQNLLVTLTAVQVAGRFGALNINKGAVDSFKEKPRGDGAWVNGGFFVINPEALEYIRDDNDVWEFSPLSNIAAVKQLSAYKHHGFWKCMDTLRDKVELENAWKSNPKWKIWKE